ncbi:hypothetical protein [Alicyclobacillus shizuokensis]|uniref:hypothetical protein n=1 Tax=Alicyclobacillus shizuokensis TaxID=392014 RepID=UPI000830BE5E|nr:hypothetical protein [Alicyclobacillus shizuokensis]MCL6626550.1 hypothetical protein [Alicyclobacillus shizuokensis]
MQPKHRRTAGKRAVVTGILRAIDLWTAILLLTGQVTTSGVYLSSGAIWLSLSGPVLGGPRQQSDSTAGGLVLDAIDVVTALLLVIGQITNTGPWISSGRLSLVLSGPAFGNSNVPVAASPTETSERAREFFADFGRALIQRELQHGGPSSNLALAPRNGFD